MENRLIFLFDQPPKVGKGCFNYVSKKWNGEVIFAYLHGFNEERKSTNWNDNDYGKAKLINLEQNPQKIISKFFKDYPEAIYVIAGFKSEIMNYLKEYVLLKKYKFICFAERPGIYGKWWKKILKKIYIPISEKMISKKYSDKVCAYLPLGKKGVDTALKYGWKEEKLYSFMYDPIDYVTDHQVYSVGSKVKLLYVGRFSKYTKGTDILIKAMDLITSKTEEYSLDMVGGYGDLREYALEWIKNKSNVNFLGLWDSKKVGMNMKKYDICIVPSKFDGWNLLVNEALRAHIGVIVTTEAVSDELISESKAGMVVSANSPRELAIAIDSAIQNKEKIQEWKYKAKQYSKHISSEKVGNYLIDILKYECLKEIESRPKCPWIKDCENVEKN